jgi:4-aminobutyrate aminotransferase-like enzyme
VIGDVDGLGLALRVEVCQEDGYTPDKAALDWMCDEAMKGDLEAGGENYGLVLDVGGYHKNVITLAPNLLITRAEIDLALALLDQLFTRAASR